MTTGSTPVTGFHDWSLIGKFAPNVTAEPEIVPRTPQYAIAASDGSSRRSYQATIRGVPSGGTAIAGGDCAGGVAASFSLCAGGHVEPGSRECREEMV